MICSLSCSPGSSHALPLPSCSQGRTCSPSGGWSLRVEPLTRAGTGEADFTLTGAGREAWKKRHPFALWDAAVTDDGRVAGYAYVGRTIESGNGGSLHVVVLSPKGEALLDEAHARRSSRFMHQAADPKALGLFVQPELGHVVVRIDDEDINRQAESSWAYDLTTGEPLFQERPKLTLALGSRSAVPPRCEPCRGTLLVLVHWYRFDHENGATGAVFHLLDAERWPVSRSTSCATGTSWRRRCVVRSGRRAAARRRDPRRRLEALRAPPRGRGPARLLHGRERRAGRVDGERDVARTVSPAGEDRSRPGDPFRPQQVHEIALGPPAPPKAEIRDIFAFGFDPEGRLRFARAEPDCTTLVQLDAAGGVLPRYARHAAVAPGRVRWFALAAPRWLAVATSVPSTAARACVARRRTDGARRRGRRLPGQDVRRVARSSAQASWSSPTGTSGPSSSTR